MSDVPIYHVAECGAHILNKDVHEDECHHCLRIRLKQKEAEIERLRAELSRVAADVELWHVLDSHWNCGCSACADIESVIAHVAGGNDELGSR